MECGAPHVKWWLTTLVQSTEEDLGAQVLFVWTFEESLRLSLIIDVLLGLMDHKCNAFLRD